MMDTENLALEQRPRALNPVHMAEVVPDIFAGRVVDCMVVELLVQTTITRILVRHDIRALANVAGNLSLNVFGRQALHLARPLLTAAFQHTKNRRLALRAAATF